MTRWREYWHAIGSDRRFTPRKGRWHRAERRAYVEGLRDANRIVEKETWAPDRSPLVKQAMRAVHERAELFADD